MSEHRVKTVVIIPNWNGRDLLIPCLDSLLTQSERDFTVTVVDNGSTDGSCELIRHRYPTVHVIARDRNYGFTGGTNPGMQDAIAHGAQYVALLNNDAIADQHWLRYLVTTADQYPQLGCITSKILQAQEARTIDSTGDFYSIWGLPFPRGRDEVDSGQYDTALYQAVFTGSGGASLFRTHMLREIGLFDQDFFAYYEDVDLGFRSQLAGWQAAYEPRAVVYHRMHATSARLPHFMRYHSHKNALYVYHKNMPARLWWKYLPYFLGGMALMAAHSLRRRQWQPLVQAYGAVLLALPALIRKRRQIQRRRVVPVARIDALLYHGLPPAHAGIFAKYLGLTQPPPRQVTLGPLS
ncbi:MAG: glycosyltransferase family 2 protein [Candidatus Tectimicrobiota bacterium]